MCRAWLLCASLAACGRVGFSNRVGDLDATHTTTADGSPLAIAYVQPFAQRHPGSTTIDTFPAQAVAASDAIVMQVSCAGSGTPSAVSVTAAGWTFTQLGGITGTVANGLWSATLVAFAPDTAMTAVSVSWTVSDCNVGKAELADEFANVDSTIGFDAYVVVAGMGNCTGDVTTVHADDAMWGACFSSTSLLDVGAGYTKGADDLGGDWAEYKLTTDPANDDELVTFPNAAVPYVLSIVALTPSA